MKVTAFDPTGMDVVSVGLFSTGYVSTSSNSYSAAVASNTLAVGGVTITGAAASNYHILASSSSAAAWVPASSGSAVPSVDTAVEFIIDGGGSAITTGIKGDLRIPFACTATAWTLLADASGSIVVDIWKDTYANYPPTDADAMPGSGKEPTITTATNATDTTITDWTTDDIAAGDILRFNVDSATTVKRVTLVLYVTRV